MSLVRERWFLFLTNAMLLAILSFPESLAAQQPAENPETVMLTYHAKQGLEAELIRTVAKHWQTVRGLKLVCDAPHVVVRGTDHDDKPFLVEVLTWRDGKIPDAPPAAVQAIWAEVGELVETRGGRSGIDIRVVSAVDLEKPL